MRLNFDRQLDSPMPDWSSSLKTSLRGSAEPAGGCDLGAMNKAMDKMLVPLDRNYGAPLVSWLELQRFQLEIGVEMDESHAEDLGLYVTEKLDKITPATLDVPVAPISLVNYGKRKRTINFLFGPQSDELDKERDLALAAIAAYYKKPLVPERHLILPEKIARVRIGNTYNASTSSLAGRLVSFVEDNPESTPSSARLARVKCRTF
jgi:hypothetical protein